MKITILTLFKNLYNEFLNTSILKRAIDQNKVKIDVVDFRNFSLDKHKKVDDYQYGGGPGMVLTLQPIIDCLNHYKSTNTKIFLTSPQGKVFNQQFAKELSHEDHLIFIAGHYEGIDARISNFIDGEISIGDYVLTGGELPTMVIVDAIVRLLDNVINPTSLSSESFDNYLLDYPVYTKPEIFQNLSVPQVLLSGNHHLIGQYRYQQQIKITKEKRPDLYKKFLERNKNVKD